MTLGTLFPPIALATVVNVFLIAWAWRATQVEKARDGKTPWYLVAGLIGYWGLLALFAYGSKGRGLREATTSLP